MSGKPGWRLRQGERLDVPSHGPAGYNRGCRCETCRSASRQRKGRQKRAADLIPDGSHGKPGTRTNLGCSCESCLLASREVMRAAYHRRQKATQQAARNAGKEWTGPELETALRADLTAVEAALLLGRTAAAVSGQRRRARVDPRKSRMAGADRLPGEVSP